MNYKFLSYLYEYEGDQFFVHDLNTNNIYVLINNIIDKPKFINVTSNYKNINLDLFDDIYNEEYEDFHKNLLEYGKECKLEDPKYNVDYEFRVSLSHDIIDCYPSSVPEKFINRFLLCKDKDDFIKNQDSFDFTDKDNSNSNDMNEDWFKEYVRLGGKHSIEVFLYNKNIFEAITLDAFIFGDCVFSRDECFTKWIKFIGSKKESLLYFHAIDNVTAYT